MTDSMIASEIALAEDAAEWEHVGNCFVCGEEIVRWPDEPLDFDGLVIRTDRGLEHVECFDEQPPVMDDSPCLDAPWWEVR